MNQTTRFARFSLSILATAMLRACPSPAGGDENATFAFDADDNVYGLTAAID